MSSTRQTRSTTRALRSQTTTPTSSSQPPSSLPSHIDLPLAIRLRNGNTRPLIRKWEWLRSHTIPPPRNIAHNPIPGTLVFGQDEAGTAVCISPNGVLLTCAHCVAETARELDLTKVHLLFFADGEAVEATVLAWDAQRDLAILITTDSPTSTRRYPYIPLSRTAPPPKTALHCIGHPGSSDLETAVPNTPTDYDTLVLSSGAFHGLAPGQDPQDNADIGALMHSCWTYWGHSGAPLVEARSGALVGLHSSWDSETGMRRGVAWEAVEGFVGELEARGRNGGGPEGWRWCVRVGDELDES